ncbi:MAG: TIGR04282 family arsenosugar biosynthesis glycosyltransferase [Salinibacter sp.]|uniref:TIGR04282 family arsenosugar biosynthesis glycosyltransferase n=1 Tax=Salinibacter sp. TaxID=2065818 RepID=UPI0035D51C51
MDQALLLFAKAPRPGAVKTRLTPVLSPAEAARLYTAFLRDTLRRVVRLDADVRLYLAPPLPDDGIDGVPTGVNVHVQQGSSLGARMAQAFRETLGDGGERVLLMGSDHPTLPLSFVRQGFQALVDDRSLCVGPAEDGGFYLLGMNNFYPQLFADMSYSHSQVLSDTLARVGRTDAHATVLPRWYDVDTPQDLARMCADLSDGQVDAPHTRRLVDRLGLETLV